MDREVYGRWNNGRYDDISADRDVVLKGNAPPAVSEKSALPRRLLRTLNCGITPSVCRSTERKVAVRARILLVAY